MTTARVIATGVACSLLMAGALFATAWIWLAIIGGFLGVR